MVATLVTCMKSAPSAFGLKGRRQATANFNAASLSCPSAVLPITTGIDTHLDRSACRDRPAPDRKLELCRGAGIECAHAGRSMIRILKAPILLRLYRAGVLLAVSCLVHE